MGLVCAELQSSSLNHNLKYIKDIVCEKTDAQGYSEGSVIQSAALHSCRSLLYIVIPSDVVKSRDSQNSNATDRPPSSPQYLPPSSCRSVAQVLRLAVNLDVVDTAIEGLRRAIRAGSQARGHHLRRHTWEHGR